MKLALTSLVLALLTVGLLATPQGNRLDRRMVSQAGKLTGDSPALRSFMELGTELGTTKWVLGGLLLPAAFGGEAARATARACALGLAANQTAVAGLKWIVARPRPSGEQPRKNSSFPSAHAAAAAGIAWAVAARHRRLAALAWLVAAWISSSRVFLERHYPSDVLAGALLGILFVALALRVESGLGRRRRAYGG